jgi:hypothetical protein
MASGVGTPWEYGATHEPYWLTQSTDVLEANHLSEGFVQLGGRRRTSWDTWSGTYSRSTDGGRTWAIDMVWPFWGGVYTSTTAVASNHGNGTALYAWEFFMLHRSLDGLPFTEIYQDFETHSVVIDPGDVLRLFCADSWNGGNVLLSTDGGESWIDRSGGLPGDQFGGTLFMDPSNPDRLAVSYRDTAYRSDDAGEHWTLLETDIEPGTVFRAVDWDPARDRFAIATDGLGVYLTDRGFANDGLPELGGLASVRFVPSSGHLLLGTGGRSVWALDLEDPVAVLSLPTTPSGLDLVLRPNPSRGSVRLELSLPGGRAEADVAIYSVTGRRIATLRRGLVASGTLTWNRRDADGTLAAPGVYFVRAAAGDRTETRKLVLIAH